MTRKSDIITERDRVILETIRLKLSEQHSLIYLQSNGYPMHVSTWYRLKSKLKKMSLQRLYHIAQIGFQDQHIETIDEYEMGFKMMWQNVLRERDPFKQNLMIKDIFMLKPYLSSYYEATKLIVQKPIIEKEEGPLKNSNNNIGKNENISLSQHRGTNEEVGLSEAERKYREQKDRAVF